MPLSVLLLPTALTVLALMGTAVSAQDHSIFSWDYSRQLGSLTWWNTWFPSCGLDYQGPVKIDWLNGVSSSTDTLVIETTTGIPLLPLDAVVAYNSTFNTVRCDMSADQVRFYIYWQPDGVTVTDKGPLFKIEKLNVLFPSEHEFTDATRDGLVDAEVRYTFASTGKFPLTSVTPLDNAIDDTCTIAFSLLLEQVHDHDGRADIETMLKQVLDGYDSGVTRITPVFPTFDAGLVHYKGTATTPPCRGNVHHFVGGSLLPVEVSTLQKFRRYGPHWDSYRTTVPAAGRPVRRVAFNPAGLVPVLRKAPYVAPYVIYNDGALFKVEIRGLALYYGAIQAGAIVGVLLVTVVVLLLERAAYKVPFSASWRMPRHGREVFGVPLRYGQETGQPKLVRGGPGATLRDPVVSEHASTAEPSESGSCHGDREAEEPATAKGS